MKNYVLALGFFDSIHIGHRYLLQKAREIADYMHTKLVVLTFDDNFLSMLNRDAKEIYLFEEKKQIMLELGVDFVEKLPATIEFLHLSKEEYLKYIQDKYNPAVIVAGSDYNFGYRAEGNVDYLEEFFAKSQTVLHICDLLQVSSSKVASSKIRLLLTEGEIEQANKLLAEPYFISGTVEHGYKIGSKINFPTANITFDDHKLVPKLGVYAVTVKIGSKSYDGIANIGNRPTFDGQKIKVEAHILDFNGDIYGKTIKVFLNKYIREIFKFDNIEQLKQQIACDIALVRQNFGVKND